MNVRSVVIWLGGRPAAGKSTLAAALSSRLRQSGIDTLWLDGERVRSVMAPELSFAVRDRRAFDSRLIELIRDAAQRHDIVIVSAAAPLKEERAYARAIMPRFIEVAVTAPADLCAKRDPKGLYEKVRLGALAGIPGIDAPYDEPTTADLVLSTESKTVAELTDELVAFVRRALAAGGGAHQGDMP
jgi:adenylylsulfate kinase